MSRVVIGVAFAAVTVRAGEGDDGPPACMPHFEGCFEEYGDYNEPDKYSRDMCDCLGFEMDSWIGNCDDNEGDPSSDDIRHWINDLECGGLSEGDDKDDDERFQCVEECAIDCEEDFVEALVKGFGVISSQVEFYKDTFLNEKYDYDDIDELPMCIISVWADCHIANKDREDNEGDMCDCLNAGTWDPDECDEDQAKAIEDYLDSGCYSDDDEDSAPDCVRDDYEQCGYDYCDEEGCDFDGMCECFTFANTSTCDAETAEELDWWTGEGCLDLEDRAGEEDSAPDCVADDYYSCSIDSCDDEGNCDWDEMCTCFGGVLLADCDQQTADFLQAWTDQGCPEERRRRLGLAASPLSNSVVRKKSKFFTARRSFLLQQEDNKKQQAGSTRPLFSPPRRRRRRRLSSSSSSSQKFRLQRVLQEEEEYVYEDNTEDYESYEEYEEYEDESGPPECLETCIEGCLNDGFTMDDLEVEEDKLRGKLDCSCIASCDVDENCGPDADNGIVNPIRMVLLKLQVATFVAKGCGHSPLMDCQCAGGCDRSDCGEDSEDFLNTFVSNKCSYYPDPTKPTKKFEVKASFAFENYLTEDEVSNLQSVLCDAMGTQGSLNFDDIPDKYCSFYSTDDVSTGRRQLGVSYNYQLDAWVEVSVNDPQVTDLESIITDTDYEEVLLDVVENEGYSATVTAEASSSEIAAKDVNYDQNVAAAATVGGGDGSAGCGGACGGGAEEEINFGSASTIAVGVASALALF